jgi:hypothetical protein
MVAKHHYMVLGYEVFTPLNPQSKCDFIISKDSRLTKVQVKTPVYYKSKSGLCAHVCLNKLYKDGDFDLLVTVLKDDTILEKGWDQVKDKKVAIWNLEED